ncbi:MAG: hypothetical protein WAW37_01565 [Syntrophobacteraceae bacterium]
MAKILDLNERKRHLAAKKGFEPWARRFGTHFEDDTSIRDLDSSIVRYLIRGGEDSAMALYEIIMGIMGLGAGPRFHYLESNNKMGVTDVTLFLLDLLRFEAMYRLGWLVDYPFLNVPLLDLVQNFRGQFSAARHQSPALSPAHPKYTQYLAEFEGDRNTFVRKMIPEAIQVFYTQSNDTEKS